MTKLSLECRYGVSENVSNIEEPNKTEGTTETVSRKSRRSFAETKKKCFICNDERISDGNAYNEGGIGRCEMDKAKERLIERSKVYKTNENSRFYEASCRFNILCNGQSFDPFAVDIYYHKSCYIKYAINPVTNHEEDIDDRNNERLLLINEVMEKFKRTIRIRIVKNKEAFLLHHILGYLKDLCEDYNIAPIHEHTVSLKRKLLKNFKNDLDYFPSGKYVIVHYSSMIPCEYSLALLKGQGLQDKDHILSFANYLRKKMKNVSFKQLPETPNEMLQSLSKYLCQFKDFA